MGTYSIIAVEEDGRFTGVYSSVDGPPFILGNCLLLSVLDAGGDLQACAKAWVYDAPEWGWSPFVARQPRDHPATDDEPSRWRRDQVKQDQTISYVYALDPPPFR